MLVFHGGLSIEQVNLLRKNKPIIFERVPKGQLFIPNKNTFDYYDPNRKYKSLDEYWEYIREDIDFNQYIFFFKYLRNALSFCHNSNKRNYILVADIEEEILNNFIGCGRYTENQIEYRVPRKFVKLDTIREFLFFEPYDDKQVTEFEQRYPDNFYSKGEDEEANQIILEKKLIFNEYKNHPKFN